MSALAWYTDVLHEVKPITSGYRLVLTYNLIHSAPGIPQPTLPDMHSAVTELRSVLQKWTDGLYPDDPELRIVAYLLKHQYNKVNLKMGTLKGEDAHKISHLRVIAQELGYVVGLATLCCHISGEADDSHGETEGWGRNATSDEEEDYEYRRRRRRTPGMAEISHTTLTIENLVDLSGSQIAGISKLKLSEENLIPDNPFEGQAPDKSDYEGYLGNGAGGLEYWYRRTVLVLFHKQDEEDILLFVQGIPYALEKLKGNAVQDKTEENYRMVQHILRHAKVYDHDGKSALRVVACYAIRWKDVEVWKQAVQQARADKNINIFGREMMLKACKKFPFDEIQSMLEDIVNGCRTFTEQVNFIQYLRTESSKQKVLQWCSKQISRILVHVKMPTAGDVEAMISVIDEKGLSVVVDALSTQVGGRDSFYFWKALITTIHGRRDDFAEHSQPTSIANENSQDEMDSYDSAMATCFDAAARQCPFDLALAISPRNYWDTRLDSNVLQMLSLMDLCLMTGNMDICAQLLSRLTATADDLAMQFQVLYFPLLENLRHLLDKHHVEFCSPPFRNFARTLIGKYLVGVLRGKPSKPTTKMRRIGCGCQDCQALDTFIMSDKPTTEFRLRQDRRAHLEERALTATDLIAFHTVIRGTPHTLVVTKRTEILKKWVKRSETARTLLSKIGDERMIAKIMGSRYGDVQKALDGTQAYAIALKPVTTTRQGRPALCSSASQRPAVGLIQSSMPSTSLSSSFKRKREGDW